MPALLAESGKGRWRHQITDIVSTATPDDAAARIHGLVTDCNEGGRPVTFADYEASPRCIDGIWHFAPHRADGGRLTALSALIRAAARSFPRSARRG